ncbi:orotidine-5'-phosphate decarboxylase [Alkalispirochaeta americana]|uniref:Orotidine-5'-phosphate decarboxylase n=1 Tax=Alkalispirochaeta americana TaxID=159291 RepID=A0A1N6Q8R7_9SPIO|nr:orotidine-5'-phosphate decarboxylase [Alkalispirochaeta americana]SIQ12948.1 orotidine-5'-phosphate decarboxylase [Alkalispirochaeta americana]
MNNYRDTLRESAVRAGSLLCVGIDPVMDWLGYGREEPQLGGPSPEEVILEHLQDFLDVVDHSGLLPGAYKPNLGYFHALDRPRQGEYQGSRTLAKILDLLQERQRGIPVILDSKRGDIARSSENYASEAFQVWGAQAVTVSPWMGDDSVTPFFMEGRGVYALARTSNPGAARFQNLPVVTSRGETPLFREVVRVVQEWSRTFPGVGIVVGATALEELGEIVAYLASAPVPLLIPGVGKQGGSAEATLEVLRSVGYPLELVRVNASRGILFPWVPAEAPRGRRERRDALAEAYRSMHQALALRDGEALQ